MTDKIYYNSVISETFFPHDSYLAAGNIFGDITIFNLDHMLHNSDTNLPGGMTNESKKKFNMNPEENHHVYSLTSNEQFLISGGMGEINGWSWNDLNFDNDKIPIVSWKIRIPSQNNQHADKITEINSMKIKFNDSDVNNNILYAGCGDNNVYAFSLENGQCLRTFPGHTDFVHSIDIRDNTLTSCSEDGSIKIWDIRTNNPVHMIIPHNNNEISRPHLGNWVGDVSLNEDWLICGGGVRLSLWNLRSLDCPMTVFSSVQDSGIHVTQFHEDLILTGGCSSAFFLINYNDEVHSQIQSSNSSVYSCAIGSLKNFQKVLCIIGNGNNIDVSTNFRYREYIIPFY